MKSCLSGRTSGDYFSRRSLTCGYENQALRATGFASYKNYKNIKMKTALIYVSKHGTTETVARKIAETVGARHALPSLINLKTDKNPDITPFDGIILGTPVYAGTPSKRMQTFIKNHSDILTAKHIGLFVCGMEPDREKQQQELENAYPPELQQQAVARHFLGGEFLFEKMNFFERAVIKRIAKTDKSISQIDEDGIEEFVTDFIEQK
jgi:menaquinone-dependent protoporphyrinogen oxidase